MIINESNNINEGIDTKEISRKLDQFQKFITIPKQDEKEMRDFLNKKNVDYMIDDSKPGRLVFRLKYRKYEACMDKDTIKLKNNSKVNEDTVKNKDGTWSNVGKEGSHGKFSSKEKADAQRKAMFVNGYKA